MNDNTRLRDLIGNSHLTLADVIGTIAEPAPDTARLANVLATSTNVTGDAVKLAITMAAERDA